MATREGSGEAKKQKSPKTGTDTISSASMGLTDATN